MAKSRVFRVLPLLLLALTAAACETEEGIFVVEEEGAKPITIEEYIGPALAAEIERIFDRFDGMVADQSLPELLELGVQRKAEIAGAITKGLSHKEFRDHGLRMPLEVYQKPVPKLDEAITAALEGY